MTLKMIYDEIHGFIKVNSVEKAIIDTPIFQRLRHIVQVGLAYLVYPGATHTRFSHSIGTLHLASKLGGNLMNEGYLTEDDVQLLRLAALLHDVGHYPLSHSLELCLLRLYGDKASHERLTIEILRRSIIADILRENGYTPNSIIGILKGEYKNKLLTQIISSDADIDKMDYLLRDSKHTGIAYGIIDIDRLVNTFSVDSEGNLALMMKGLGALENLYMARLQMYKTVYYHKTIIAFELMLNEIYRELLERGEVMSLNEIYNGISTGDFSFFNDHYVYNKLYGIIRSEKAYPHSIVKYTRMFITRKPLKIVRDLSQYLFSVESVKSHKIEVPDFITHGDKITFKTIVLFIHKPVKVIIDEKGASVPVIDNSLQTIIKYMPRGLIIERTYTTQC